LPDFDLVLIDCPPNLYQLSWNAILAADYVLIPVPPEDFGTQGLRPVHQAIASARIQNPRLALLGHVVSRYDGRLVVHQTYEQKLRRLYGQGVLRTVIPEASAIKVALACREPEDIRRRVDAGEISARAAYELSRLKDTPKQRQLADRLATGHLTHEEAAQMVRRRQGTARRVPRGTSLRFLTGQGWKLTVSAPCKGTYHDIEQALEEVLAEVRHCIRNNVHIF